MRQTSVIMLASNNAGKLREYRSLLKDYLGLELRALDEVVSNATRLERVETGSTYAENALLKGRLAHLAAKLPTLSDDTGLEVDALGGRPGVFSDRYAIPRDGESKSTANVRRLLEELKDVPKEKRTARFVCATYFFAEGTVLSATASLEGSILELPRGAYGFGYDPIFLIKGTNLSLAELSLEEKNRISHRAKALRELMTQITTKGIKFVHP